MTAVVYAFGTRERSPLPWQNHELSELYRVVDLLGKAGLAVETDMGLSDEGEPWFVFCRADTGDVVVHFARIDGQYVAASSVVDQSYRGGNFRDIIEQLVSQQPLVMPRGGSGVSLFLHPAVVLTAFVATALAHSHRAEAADGSGDSVPVSLHDGKNDGYTDLLLKLLSASVQNQGERNQSRSNTASETTSHIATMMAIAIAAIVPLVDQSVSLSLPSPLAVTTDHSAASAVELGADDGATGLPVIVPVHSGKVSALDLPPSDSVNFDHIQTMSLHASSTTAISLPISTLPSETVATPATTSHASDSSPSGEHSILHIAIRQPMPLANNSSNQSGAATQTTADTGHHFTLSDFDPEAVQVFFQQHETAAHSTSSSTVVVIPTLPSSNVTNGSGAITSPPSHGGTENQTTAFPTETNVTLNTWSAPELVYVLNEFAFSGTHPLVGSMQPSDYLRMAVAAYEKANGGPIQLIVFDEATPLNSIFPLTKGVLFVEDKELGATAQTLHGTNTVSLTLGNGDVMKLIGVITVDATHPLMG